MKKIYISGKISGLTEEVYAWKFARSIQNAIKKYDCEIVSPLSITPLFCIEKWLFHMIADIWQLLKCDAILLQPDWIDSRGSKIEVFVAILAGKQIIVEK